MFSKRSLEGEILIDHSASPGLTPADVPDLGMDIPIVGKGERFESAINTCGHCAAAIILNPNRTRERGWCQHCDRYICDTCTYLLHQTLRCNTVKRRLEQAYEEAERGVNPLLITKL